MDNDVLTAEEAAQFLRVDVATLYASIRAGEIPHQKLGRRVLRLSRSGLIRWLAEGRHVDDQAGSEAK